MEIFIDIIKQGNIKIELLARGNEGCSVIFTITDEDDRRILKSAIMDNGKIKIYASAEEAIKDAIMKLTSHPEKI
jgi:hypothetical protein